LRAPLTAAAVAVAEPVPVPAAARVVIIATAIGPRPGITLPAAVTLATLAAITLAGGITLTAAVTLAAVTLAAVTLAAVTLVMALLARIAAARLAVPPAVAAALIAALTLAARLAFASGHGHAANAIARRGAVRPDLSAASHRAASGRPIEAELAVLAAVRRTLTGFTSLRSKARLASLCFQPLCIPALCFRATGRNGSAQAGLC
jgi:hypothetical protein